MIQVEEMNNREIKGFLRKSNYGHLACARDNQPYIVPIHYAYDAPYVYIYTTEGLKAEIIRDNPQICLQVENVIDNAHWQSVVMRGVAKQVTTLEEREKSVELIRRINPTLTPAISIRWMDNWVRENVEVIFRIEPDIVTGRRGSPIKTRGAAATRPKICV